MSAQFASFLLKDKRCARIILDFAQEFDHVHLAHALVSIVAKMLTRLSILWNFKQHGHVYGSMIAHDVVEVLSMRDRVFILLSQNHDCKYSLCAIGVLWGDFVRSLSMSVFQSCLRKEEDLMEVDLKKRLQSGLREINEENVLNIANHMAEMGVKNYLYTRPIRKVEEDLPDTSNDSG